MPLFVHRCLPTAISLRFSPLSYKIIQQRYQFPSSGSTHEESQKLYNPHIIDGHNMVNLNTPPPKKKNTHTKEKKTGGGGGGLIWRLLEMQTTNLLDLCDIYNSFNLHVCFLYFLYIRFHLNKLHSSPARLTIVTLGLLF